MKYIENAFKFTINHYLILVPIFAATVITGLWMSQAVSLDFLRVYSDIIAFSNDPSSFLEFGYATQVLGRYATFFAGASLLGLVLQFVSLPITAGVIKKALDDQSVTVNDYVPALKENVLKYVMYYIGRIVLNVVITVPTFIIAILLLFVGSFLGSFVILVAILIVLAVIALFITVNVVTSFWFSAMVLDNEEVVGALKKSVKVAKTCFGTLILVTIIISIAAGVVGGILGVTASIPLIGAVIGAAAPTLGTVLQMVFVFTLYREKVALV